MAKSRSQPVNLPSARPLMNYLHLYLTEKMTTCNYLIDRMSRNVPKAQLLCNVQCSVGYNFKCTVLNVCLHPVSDKIHNYQKTMN